MGLTKGSSQLCVCTQVSNTSCFFVFINLSFTKEKELLLETIFNMTTSTFGVYLLIMSVFLLNKKIKIKTHSKSALLYFPARVRTPKTCMKRKHVISHANVFEDIVKDCAFAAEAAELQRS